MKIYTCMTRRFIFPFFSHKVDQPTIFPSFHSEEVLMFWKDLDTKRFIINKMKTLLYTLFRVWKLKGHCSYSTIFVDQLAWVITLKFSICTFCLNFKTGKSYNQTQVVGEGNSAQKFPTSKSCNPRHSHHICKMTL